MLSLRRPDDAAIAAYRRSRLGMAVTSMVAEEPPPGFRQEHSSRAVGTGPDAFERGRAGVEQWVAHRGSGVEVFPAEVGIAAGETVVIVTRQAGVWVMAACRIEQVINEPGAFGFVYATLPGHPERGYESFIVAQEDGEVRFHIDAVSKPGTLLVRLGGPVTRWLQRRATTGYLDAIEKWTQPAG